MGVNELTNQTRDALTVTRLVGEPINAGGHGDPGSLSCAAQVTAAQGEDLGREVLGPGRSHSGFETAASR
jgi:hypothetical protein